MPTPSEQKALAFLAFVILLGGVVRVVRAGAAPVSTAAEQGALARQAAAADSAARRGRAKKPRKGAKLTGRRRDGGADTVAGVAGVPFQDVRPGASALGSGREGWVNGFPPPLPRIDIDNRQSPVDRNSVARPAASAPVRPVDLDAASVAEIEALPRVGPAMAARIVGNRDSLGAFGSLEGLGRVRGMGPATRKSLAPYVTFGGVPASSTARRRYY